jgi:hypothetical protein
MSIVPKLILPRIRSEDANKSEVLAAQLPQPQSVRSRRAQLYESVPGFGFRLGQFFLGDAQFPPHQDSAAILLDVTPEMVYYAPMKKSAASQHACPFHNISEDRARRP